jgi:hypothetical protein
MTPSLTVGSSNMISVAECKRCEAPMGIAEATIYGDTCRPCQDGKDSVLTYDDLIEDELKAVATLLEEQQ